ncbi:hypothetical protein [Streptomyces sp. CdTB01]|uniref:hypothetical protein n=1 Tax=Streptomyces sp. CdTB01 TaxID=1725411 RepID=UPI00073A5C86|nr:hypothetical protein [Streptomyces sp. CdTB01]ALV33231.1 hypothetical protein AS200_15230 [Streptomyces sp. CdTB01]
MPIDVYAAVGALVRAEITRKHTQPVHPPTQQAAARTEDVAPKPTIAAVSQAPARRRLRTRATAVLRRLDAVSG